MTKQAPVTSSQQKTMRSKTKLMDAFDQAFSVRFGLFLALLTTFIVPLALASPLIVAQLFGYRLVDQLGITADNFGVFVLVCQSIGLLTCLAVIRRKLKLTGASWFSMGLRRFKLFKALRYIAGYYLILISLLIIASIVAVSFLNGVDVPKVPQEGGGDAEVLSLMGGFWYTFALTVVLAPIVEEIVFRGVLFPAVAKRYGLIAGIIGSSLIFMLVHLNPIQMISVLPLGIYLAIMYRKTGSIYPGIILHAVWNFMTLMIAQSYA